jgi:hypothetical protein
MTLTASARAFRAAVLALGPRAKNSTFPPELRRLALAHLVLARRHQLSDPDAAKQLGICLDTLLRWEQSPPPAFHELTLFQPPAPTKTPLSFSVSGPRGLRLDDLDLDAVVAIWTKLS